MHELGKTKDKIERMQKIKDNLAKVAEHVQQRIRDLKEACDKREEERLQFDHYRNKVNEMEKAGKQSTSDKIED